MPDSIVDQLGTLSQIDAVVHLGAGSGLDLPGLLAISARRIVLVEPNAAVLPALKKAATDKRCKVLALAVAQTQGPAQLLRFSFPALSSLKAPLKALTELFPGLTETAPATVDTLPLEAILARAELDRSEKNALIIDAPGMEGEIVDMAIALDPAVRFAHIILRAAAVALYEDARSFATLSDTLEAAGYRRESRLSADPDFPEGWFRLDRLALKVRRLETDLDNCNAGRVRAEESAGAYKKKAEELEQRLKALTAEHEAMTRTLNAQQGKLTAQSAMLNTARSQNATLQEQLNRESANRQKESANRQKMESEFLCAEAQMQLMKEFADLSAKRNAPTYVSKPARPQSRRARAKKA